MKFLSDFKKVLLNIPGQNLNRKLVVFESDDWGSERIPSAESLIYLKSKWIDLKSNAFNHLDSLESEDDLNAAFEVLKKHKGNNGKHPAITANSLTANPDFERIKSYGFSKYIYESVVKTYHNKRGSEGVMSLIKQGMDEGIYHPQFHGREHLNVNQWMSALQSGNKVLKHAFEVGIYGVDLEVDLTNRSNFMAAFDISSDADINAHEKIIQEGILQFKEIYGFQSESFIAPCYVWHPNHEAGLLKNGVKYFQGLPVQLAPDHKKQYKRIYHYQGQKNKLGQRYFVRNCFFEPSLNPQFNWVEDCLNRMRIIFNWGKPVIIGSHRINFVGGLKESNRKHNLELLDLLLKKMLILWPDIEFTTTDKLGNIYDMKQA